jgi:hypothetical protein
VLKNNIFITLWRKMGAFVELIYLYGEGWYINKKAKELKEIKEQLIVMIRFPLCL